MRGPQRFTVPRAVPSKKPPVESITWWWNPGRAGVRLGPPRLMKKLADVDPKLSLTWNAYNNHWSVWLQTPRIQHPICSGWSLLFNVDPADLGEGELILARLYSASARAFGGAKEYFEAVMREEEREAAKAAAAHEDQTIYEGWDRLKSFRPSVGYGASNGSKTANWG